MVSTTEHTNATNCIIVRARSTEEDFDTKGITSFTNYKDRFGLSRMFLWSRPRRWRKRHFWRYAGLYGYPAIRSLIDWSGLTCLSAPELSSFDLSLNFHFTHSLSFIFTLPEGLCPDWARRPLQFTSRYYTLRIPCIQLEQPPGRATYLPPLSATLIWLSTFEFDMQPQDH
jgi:hypothetical protein